MNFRNNFVLKVLFFIAAFAITPVFSLVIPQVNEHGKIVGSEDLSKKKTVRVDESKNKVFGQRCQQKQSFFERLFNSPLARFALGLCVGSFAVILGSKFIGSKKTEAQPQQDPTKVAQAEKQNQEQEASEDDRLKREAAEKAEAEMKAEALKKEVVEKLTTNKIDPKIIEWFKDFEKTKEELAETSENLAAAYDAAYQLSQKGCLDKESAKLIQQLMDSQDKKDSDTFWSYYSYNPEGGCIQYFGSYYNYDKSYGNWRKYAQVELEYKPAA